MRLRTIANKFWQDRQAMKAGNFTGITGLPNQDVALWLTMGPIADRSNDRLGASDLATDGQQHPELESSYSVAA